MKIAFVIHDINRRGGQERSTLEILHGLSRDFECHVFASTAEDLPPNVHFHRVPVFLRRPLIIKDFVFRLFASLQVALGRFDLVHATGPCVLRADVFTLQFIQKRWKLERKIVPSRFFLQKLKDFLQSTVDGLSEAFVIKLNRNASYVAISEQVRGDLNRLYNLKNIVSIRHGVNLEEFNFEERTSSMRSDLAPLPNGRKLLLFVGAFERKGLFYLLDALPSVFDFFPDWDLVVIGQGPIELAKAQCRLNKIEGRVHFLGNQTDMAKYYSACDLFILPSLYDPFGLVAIEALASGCPVVVSKASGSSDLVEEGVNGWVLSDATNADEIASVLKIAFSCRLESMRKSARHSVENEHWSSKIEQYKQMYLALKKQTH